MTAPRAVDSVYHLAPGAAADRLLLVMLPGVNILPGDFVDHGFIEALRRRRWPVDVVTAAPDVELYLDDTIAERIHRDIVAPAQARGYRRIWFLGVSLGGMGALLHARAHAAALEGVVLLAPFVGTPGMVAEVSRAGGLSAWEPGEIRARDGERKLLAWLKSYRAGVAGQPQLYLGYGRRDRFAEGHALLARHLPAERVLVAEGGHDWETWTMLWQRILDRAPFPFAAG